MISKTKPELNSNDVSNIFSNAVMGKMVSYNRIGDGEYNSVYEVKTDMGTYVLKVSPIDTIPILTYEKDMMRTEVYWYAQMRSHTDIKVPQVFFKDFSHKIYPADYFIMEKIDGTQLLNAKLTKAENKYYVGELASNASELHKITNNQFGYVQNALYDNWYLAFRSMVKNVIDDCERMNKKTKRGKTLLMYIDTYKQILEKVPCSLVNFDIHGANVLLGNDIKQSMTWIDPERSFWGDAIFEFVCFEMLLPLKKKKISIKAYNESSKEKITLSREQKIRYAFAVSYMALIMETEKYYRYSPKHFGWWRNIFSSAFLYNQGLKVLKNEKR